MVNDSDTKYLIEHVVLNFTREYNEVVRKKK